MTFGLVGDFSIGTAISQPDAQRKVLWYIATSQQMTVVCCGWLDWQQLDSTGPAAPQPLSAAMTPLSAIISQQ